MKGLDYFPIGQKETETPKKCQTKKANEMVNQQWIPSQQKVNKKRVYYFTSFIYLAVFIDWFFVFMLHTHTHIYIYI